MMKEESYSQKLEGEELALPCDPLLPSMGILAPRERTIPRRLLLAITGILCILFTSGCILYLGLPSSAVAKMPEPYVAPTVPIQVTLSHSSANSNFGSATIHVTLTNLCPYPLSLLRWSSPLDARAIATGAVRFISTTTNKTAPYLNIKINRKLPESGYFSVEDEWITTIPASGTAQKELKAGEPEVALTKGEKYRVIAEGRWMGVWRREHEQEGEVPQLKLDDAMTGDFESNEIEIEIPAGEGGEL